MSMLRGMASAGLSHIGPELAGAEEGLLLAAGDPGGLDAGFPPKATSKSCLAPVARLVPDVAVLVLLTCAVGWCWVSTWLLISTGPTEISWNVSLYQLGPLTAVCFFAGLKIFMLRPLETELSHFKAENGKFKESIGQLHTVAGSLKAKADHFQEANDELQQSISELQNVRGVIEMYAVKTHGDVGQILEEVKSSVYDQLEIQQRTKRTQQRIRGLIDILLNAILLNGAHGVPGTSRVCSEDFEDIVAMLEGSDSASGQDLAHSLNGLRDRADAERSTSQLTRSIVAKLVQLDKDEDADPGARGTQAGPRHTEASPKEAEKASTGAASLWPWPRAGGEGSPPPPVNSKAGPGSPPQGQRLGTPGSPPQGQRLGTPGSPGPGLGTPGSAKGGKDSPAGAPKSPTTRAAAAQQRFSPSSTRAAAGSREISIDQGAGSPWRHAELSREISFDQSSRSSDRSVERPGRGPRISFGRGEVGTYFGDPGSPPLPRLPEDPQPGGAGPPGQAWQPRSAGSFGDAGRGSEDGAPGSPPWASRGGRGQDLAGGAEARSQRSSPKLSSIASGTPATHSPLGHNRAGNSSTKADP